MQEERTLFKVISHANKSFKKGDILTVSDLGNVKCNGEPYECSINPNGYKYLCGKYLHRIVAEKFLSYWDPNKEADHKDTNRLAKQRMSLARQKYLERKSAQT